MKHHIAIAVSLLAISVSAAGEKPIEQDLEKIERRYAAMLEYNRQTLAGAYDTVGKKDPRWDAAAREALDAMARWSSQDLVKPADLTNIYPATKRAIDAGCDDPLILYLLARSSYQPNFPGAAEFEKRHINAAKAMAESQYPVERRLAAILRAGAIMSDNKAQTAEGKKQAEKFLDDAAKLLPEKLIKATGNQEFYVDRLEDITTLYTAYRRLEMEPDVAFDRIDDQLKLKGGLAQIRNVARGKILITWAWDARTGATADKVTEVGFKVFHQRLTEAKEVLEKAWEDAPDGDGDAANLMLRVEKGMGEERADMEKWFERAIKADSTSYSACVQKLDWLDPKWHGSQEEMLEFGRVCGQTKCKRTKIPLIVADAYLRAYRHLEPAEQQKWFLQDDVWNEIKTVYSNYLTTFPRDHVERTNFAGFCALARKFDEANKEFQTLGNNLTGSQFFKIEWLRQTKTRIASALEAKEKSKSEPKDEE